MEKKTTGQLPPAACVNKALEIYVVLMFWVTASSWLIYILNPTFDRRPVFGKYDQFRDLTNYAAKTEHLWHGAAKVGSGFPIYNYPPPGIFVFQFFNHLIPTHPVETYFVCLFTTLLMFAVVAWKAACRTSSTKTMAAAAIAVTFLIADPTWFTADRGNIEWVVWAFSAAGLCFLLARRNGLGAAFIGLASSIKPFSILFLALLLRRRKYKELVLGLAVTAAVITLAAVILGPNPWRAYQALKPGGTYYMTHYVQNLMHPEEARFGHSILDGMKIAALTVETRGIHPTLAIPTAIALYTQPGGWSVVHSLVRVYPWILLVGTALMIKVFYRMPLVNQITAIAGAVSLCPPVAAEYTLLQFYVPFGAFLVFLTRDVATGRANFSYRAMAAYATLYALLFVPLTFLRIYAGTAKLILILVLLCVAAKTPMRSAYFGDLPSEANA